MSPVYWIKDKVGYLVSWEEQYLSLLCLITTCIFGWLLLYSDLLDLWYILKKIALLSPFWGFFCIILHSRRAWASKKPIPIIKPNVLTEIDEKGNDLQAEHEDADVAKPEFDLPLIW